VIPSHLCGIFVLPSFFKRVDSRPPPSAFSSAVEPPTPETLLRRLSPFERVQQNLSVLFPLPLPPTSQFPFRCYFLERDSTLFFPPFSEAFENMFATAMRFKKGSPFFPSENIALFVFARGDDLLGRLHEFDVVTAADFDAEFPPFVARCTINQPSFVV